MAGETILVAEDDRVTLRFVSSLLEDQGYAVLPAEDGRRAHELALGQRPDLIVTDLLMPYEDGFEFIRRIRAEPTLARTPILILSTKSREEDIVLGLEEGADDYMIKPFRAREFLVRIRKLLDRRRERN